MFNIFRALIERLKALFATTAAQELEAEFLTRHAERKAELLRRAAQYDSEGLSTIAQELRQQAQTLSIHQPLAIILPVIEHCQGDTTRPSLLLGSGNAPPPDNFTQEPAQVPQRKRKSTGSVSPETQPTKGTRCDPATT